jgi:DNA-3-methyladenine glycosylase
MIPIEFYQRDDVLAIARDLLGTLIYTKIDGDEVTGGVIIETEAYAGIEDKASHAYGGRRTARTEVMFASGGIAYVYLCYGIHSLLNVVTNVSGIPHAVLIRAIHPTIGIKIMEKRRKGNVPLANGPGKLTQALGIRMLHNLQPFSSESLWIEPRKEVSSSYQIVSSQRIGIDYAEEHALLPWRFCLSNH